MNNAEPDAQITVTLPPDTRFIALTRVTAASLGAELDWSLDDIDGLRLVVDELASIAMQGGAASGADEIRVHYRINGDGAISIEAEVDGDVDLTSDLDEITHQILAAAADSHTFGPGSLAVTMRSNAP